MTAPEQEARDAVRAMRERDAYTGAFESAWWCSSGPRTPVERDWRNSLRTFHKRGLPAATMVEFVELAAEKSGIEGAYGRWRYFLGCCWRRLEQDGLR